MTEAGAGSYEYLAVRSAHGPHVTPAAGVRMFGRYWTTTSRSALKYRSVRRHGVAGVSVISDDEVITATGRASVIDPSRPISALSDLATVPLAPLAVARLGVSHLREVLGYLESFQDTPSAWSPLGRVIIMVELDHEVRTPYAPFTGRRRPDADLRRALTVNGLATSVIDSLNADRCALGFDTSRGPVALPTGWNGSAAICDTNLLDRLSATTNASVTLDRSAARRPDEKAGLMLRGPWTAGPNRAGARRVGVEPDRVTWWNGFASGTLRGALDAGRAA